MSDNVKEYEYCLRCGRKLKNPKARMIGYGVTCEKKMKHNAKRRLFDGKRVLQSDR